MQRLVEENLRVAWFDVLQKTSISGHSLCYLSQTVGNWRGQVYAGLCISVSAVSAARLSGYSCWQVRSKTHDLTMTITMEVGLRAKYPMATLFYLLNNVRYIYCVCPQCNNMIIVSVQMNLGIFGTLSTEYCCGPLLELCAEIFVIHVSFYWWVLSYL